MAVKQYATHVDTEIRFFDTLDEAESHAAAELTAINQDGKDGIDEELAGGVCIMRVVSRATCVNPDAHYSQHEYQMISDRDQRQWAMIMLRGGWQVKLSPSSTRIQWRSPHGISGSDFESDTLDCPPAAAIAQHKKEFPKSGR